MLSAPKIGPELPTPENRPDVRDFVGGSEAYYEDGAYVSVENGYFDESRDGGEYYEGEEDYDEDQQDGQQESLPYEEDDINQEEEVEEGYECDEGGEDIEAAEAVILSLHDKFLQLREHLRREPPQVLVSALPNTHSPFIGRLGPKSKTFLLWSKRMRAMDPSPVQVAAMDRSSILRLFRIILGGKFLRVGVELRERTSRWLWALLARLPDSGELTSSEISIIRDLGLRAVLLTRSVAEMAVLREEVEKDAVNLGMHDGFDDSEDDEEDDIKDMSPMENGEEEETASPSGNNSIRSPDGNSPNNNNDALGEERLHVPNAGGPNGEAEKTGAPVEPEEFEEGEVSEGEQSEPDIHGVPTATVESKAGEQEDGAPMDIDGTSSCSDSEEDLEAARARLLARIENGLTPDDNDNDENNDKETDATNRARLNMRATLNMIITVAGEFYGQRDLLEFRDPFMGM